MINKIMIISFPAYQQTENMNQQQSTKLIGFKRSDSIID